MTNDPVHSCTPGKAWGLSALLEKRQAIRDNQARCASLRERWIKDNAYFYREVGRLLRFIVEPGRRVLNLRSQLGHLLKAVRPARGVGVEVCPEMTNRAKDLHPEFDFVTSDVEDLCLKEEFDYVLFDNITETVDILAALNRVRTVMGPSSRLLVYTYNHLWEPLLWLAEKAGWHMPQLDPNWLSEHDIENMFGLTGFQLLRTYRTLLCPKPVPLLSSFLNRVLAKLPGLNRLCMVRVMVARPVPTPRPESDLTVSVVIPAKNECGNIETAVGRIPAMGRHTEIIFCDDRSTDGTGDEIRRMQREHPDLDIKLVEGPGVCKAQNVWAGFRQARGDVLMILDADLAVMPEELPLFLSALAEGAGEFINGSRLVYPVPREAMRFFNLFGNKAFSLLFSFLLGQPMKDTLCGTKVLWRTDWDRIVPHLDTWGIADRWGDYELLFGAAKLHLRIVDLPVHYQERMYGTTKMVRVVQNGLIMLRMCLAAFRKLKLAY